MPRHKYRRRSSVRAYVLKGRRVRPQYLLKPRLTTRRAINPLRSNNFKQRFFAQTGSGRRRRHRRVHARIGRRKHGHLVYTRPLYHGMRRRHRRRRGRGPVARPGFRRARHGYTKPVYTGFGRRHRHRHSHRRRHRHRRGRVSTRRGLRGPIGHVYHKGKVVGFSRRHRRHRRRHGMRRHRRHRRRRHGRGVWDDIKNGARKVHDFVKANKLVSSIGRHVSDFLPGPYREVGHALSNFADEHGYGRRKHRKRGGRRKKHRRRSHRGGFQHLGVVSERKGYGRRPHFRGRGVKSLSKVFEHIPNSAYFNSPRKAVGGRRPRGMHPLHHYGLTGRRHMRHRPMRGKKGGGTPWPFVEADKIQGQHVVF